MKYAVALAAAALGLAAPAGAATYSFTLSGDYSASWELDSNPTPDRADDGYSFYLYGVTGNFPGLVGDAVTMRFYTYESLLGGVSIVDEGTGLRLTDPYGQQLFDGALDAPHFLTGHYSLINNLNGNSVQLVIAEATAAVPEPAAWGMMIAGFGLVGGAMRRRQQVQLKVSYAA